MVRRGLWLSLLMVILATLACGGGGSGAPSEVQPTPSVVVPTPPVLEGGGEYPPPLVTPLPRDMGHPYPPDLQISPPAWTPESQDEARAAIQTYAQDVLGIEIQVVIAVGRVQELNLPLETEDDVNAALALSGVTYFGGWEDGLAALALGEGSATGDYVTDIQDGSVGAFSLRLNQALPQDAEAALALVRETFPGLAGLEFFSEGSDQGFAFSTAQAQDWQIMGDQVTLSGLIASAGVLPGRRPTNCVVWVVLASGALTTPFE
jgi:hypothetical protein